MNIEPLIIKFLSNGTFDISNEELEYLGTWIENPKNESIFLEYVKINAAIEKHMHSHDLENAQQKIRSLIKLNKKRHSKRKVKKIITFTLAASILLMVGLNVFLNQEMESPFADPIIENTIIQTGTDKATLTLADGSEIFLKKGEKYIADGLSSNGQDLVYDTEIKSEDITHNILTIPKGGQFHVVLSDSTEVWLNSDSQIKYPMAFIGGKTRQVELIYGEAYFDVSPNTKHNGATFKVISKNQEVEVLGTEFNVKAYSDENSIYTTLVEGKVAVDFGFEKETLIPNQQSIINIATKKVTVDFVDVYNETSWKNGIFSFKSKSLKDIMKVLSRWYDVEVVFLSKDLEEVKFIGLLSKNQNIEDILLTIKNTNFINAYEIKNNTIILK
ncbi:FecR family protein [Gillisia sp. Hel_I_86]|uniref:FecR family protein n=1 Tax=Gillisia sp. Hel_I_86 TaxID=1249981 RepID=UPI00119AC5B2|nr:FecR family protein [Gillisia sp. Hel_I_86]TVZ27647.1 FecR family protein [Gillisia sp. Hel_I_86]